MLHPGTFTSETLGSMPVHTRWTWIGMLTYLDDFGRGSDNAQLVKAAVWPLDDNYTSKKVAADLDRLTESGSICRYECCGRRQLHAIKWEKFQRVAHPTDSIMCPCPVHEADIASVHGLSA